MTCSPLSSGLHTLDDRLADPAGLSSDRQRRSVAGVFHDVAGKPFNGDRAATRRLNQLMAGGAYLTVALPVDRLNATQAEVNGDYLMAPDRYAGAGDALPAVVKYQGRYYVTDGHHRLMAAAHHGIAAPAVRLYDLDGDTVVEFPLLDGLASAEDDVTQACPSPW